MNFTTAHFSIPRIRFSSVLRIFCALTLLCIVPFSFNANAASALSAVAQIAMDGDHSCVLLQTKSVRCWGANRDGQLGNGSSIASEVPVPVFDLNDAVSIEVFGSFSCALTQSGQIKCWGFLSAGSLDIGIGQPSVAARTPMTIGGLSGVSAFGMLWGRLCAVVTGGAVQCIGGDPGPSPVTIPVLRNATKVVVGFKHACALLDGGTVHCWGTNAYGQLGDGSATGSSSITNVPVLVNGLNDVIAMAASSDTTCAVTRPGSVFCWGVNGGLFGNGNNLGSSTPVRIGTLDDVTSISAGSGHICALRRGGGVTCWGGNHDGNGSVTGAVGGPEWAAINLPPTIIDGAQGAVYVAVGRSSANSCAIFADSTVGCWGTFLSADRSTRIAVHGLSEVTSISAGLNHSCAVQVSGAVLCWGSNGYGQLGNGMERSSGLPLKVLGLPLSVGVAAGQSHTCSAGQDGRAWCWGSNTFGQLGDGTLVNRLQAVAVQGTSGVRAVVAGGGRSCALLSSGSVQCWGSGRYGELGDGRSVSSNVPVMVSGITNAIAIAASETSTCAVLADGAVWCWGFDNNGSMGTVPTVSSVASTPARMSGLGSVQSISASAYDRFCTLLRDGNIFCWNTNLYGEAGGARFVNGVAIPASGILAAKNVAAGALHTCVVLAAGQTKCFGRNNHGQLGTRSSGNTSFPTNVEGVNGATSVVAGANHSCALLSDASVACWGANYYGQIGDGRKGFSSTPQTVLAAPKRVMMTELLFVPLNYYFITSRDGEKALLAGLTDWRRTGESFAVFAENEPDTSAVNRFYFDRVAKNESRGSHFYTGLDSEKAVLRALNPGNLALPKQPVDEGIDSFVYSPVVDGVGGLCAAGQVPVYRAFRGDARFPDDPNHRFTTNVTTYNSIVASGWTAEGVKLCISNVP